VRATDRLHSCFRKTEVLDLTFLNQVFDGAGDVLNRHVRVNPMLIEQIDVVGLKSLERRFGDSAIPLMCAGRLSVPLCLLPSNFSTNHVAIAT
jgi:hypothetical protein